MEMVAKDWPVVDIVRKYPSSVEIMLSYKIPCIGCSTPAHMPLSTMAEQVGLPEEKVNEVVDKINKLISENEPTTIGLINLTKKAAEKMQEIMAKDNKSGQGIKVAVLPGGCSGFSYGLDFQEAAGKDEETVESSGINLYVEKEDVQLLKGLKIDYVDTLQGGGFKITNPNATHTCSCGQSFS